jgi:hypothetical protein
MRITWIASPLSMWLSALASTLSFSGSAPLVRRWPPALVTSASGAVPQLSSGISLGVDVRDLRPMGESPTPLVLL